MSWANQLEALDNRVLNTFPTTATFNPQSGGSQTITGVIASPAMAEDYVPGLSSNVTVVRLFVRFVDITPSPQKGDRISLAGGSYDVFYVLVDIGGGAVLKLRSTS